MLAGHALCLIPVPNIIIVFSAQACQNVYLVVSALSLSDLGAFSFSLCRRPQGQDCHLANILFDSPPYIMYLMMMQTD